MKLVEFVIGGAVVAICFGFGFGVWAIVASLFYGPSPRMISFACGIMVGGWLQMEFAQRRRRRGW